MGGVTAMKTPLKLGREQIDRAGRTLQSPDIHSAADSGLGQPVRWRESLLLGRISRVDLV